MGKDKDKDKNKDGGTAADADIPNFYCRRNPTIPRQDQPRPYAFLQRILSEHRVRTDDSVDQFDGVDDINNTLAGTGSANANGTAESFAIQAGSGAITAVQNGRNLCETASTLAETSGSSDANSAAGPSDTNNSSSSPHTRSGSSEAAPVEEELPWFSQLSAYPQLRSAGIPLVPDEAPSSKMGALNGASTKKRP
ncbi:hypothetical protein, partial [Sporisorium scitamineum]